MKFKEFKLEPFILSIDAGTTGITVLILDKQASICKKYYKEFTQYYPQSGWVEHDGEEIWSATLMLLQSAFHDFSINNCAAIGITNQRETTLIWNRKTGKPIHHAIVWQCRRTEDHVDPGQNHVRDSGDSRSHFRVGGRVVDDVRSRGRDPLNVFRVHPDSMDEQDIFPDHSDPLHKLRRGAPVSVSNENPLLLGPSQILIRPSSAPSHFACISRAWRSVLWRSSRIPWNMAFSSPANEGTSMMSLETQLRMPESRMTWRMASIPY